MCVISPVQCHCSQLHPLQKVATGMVVPAPRFRASPSFKCASGCKCCNQTEKRVKFHKTA